MCTFIEMFIHFSLCFIFPTIILKIWMNEFNRSCSKIHPGTTKSIDLGVRKRIFVWRKFNSAFGFYLLFHFGINQLLLIIAAFLGISTILNNQLNFNLYSLRQFSFVFQSMGTGKEIEKN